MRALRNQLKIMFGKVSPEALLDNIIYYHDKSGKFDENNRPLYEINSQDISSISYHHFSDSIFRNFIYEEVDMRYDHMKEVIKERGKTSDTSVFALLPEYTCHVLREDGEKPVCRQDQFLNWRDCYLALGQDLLVAAHLAYNDVNENRIRNSFGWSAMIDTDDRRLLQIIDRGIAENHFHLNGSTRSFDLTWLCLMNHPEQIKKYFSKQVKKMDADTVNELFKEDLNVSVSSGEFDNSLPWIDKLMIACWLRVQLFKWLENGDYHSFFQNKNCVLDDFLEFWRTIPYCLTTHELRDMVESMRYISGKGGGKFEQLNGIPKCLDYAITGELLRALPDDCPTRALVGERALLYNSLFRIYSHELGESELSCQFSDLFYLYILIKNQFRSEIVQVNNKYGFKNFALYQNRKDLIYEDYPEYDIEAKNLSVNDSIKNGNVESLEMRIGPKSTSSEQYNKILQTDKAIRFLCHEKDYVNRDERKKAGLNSRYFYVLHFPKKPESLFQKPRQLEEYENPSDILYSLYGVPRNSDVRRNTKTQAKAVAKAMEMHDWLCTRIRGIDACNFEIGCRPEVFATEFRFLRSFVPQRPQRDIPYDTPISPKLSATYHAGEDFMDIVDGLRAIDEAMVFLELDSGDRLGHALALGIDPYDYYRLKGNSLVLKKQDLLDNIIWALNKSKTLSIHLDSALKQRLYDDANRLIYEIYGEAFRLEDYYRSYWLRGDDPELYRYGRYDKEAYESYKRYMCENITFQYNFCRIRQRYHTDRIDPYRYDPRAARLYWLYHFNHDVKIRGNITEEKRMTEPYIRMVEALQNGLQSEIARNNIAIECNPSSNVLIGSFSRYDQHPILRLYPVLPRGDEMLQFVSINTDDQGVFDTSLKTEYALLASALKKIKKDDKPMYNDDTIYGYIERIRENGFAQIFPHP